MVEETLMDWHIMGPAVMVQLLLSTYACDASIALDLVERTYVACNNTHNNCTRDWD